MTINALRDRWTSGQSTANVWLSLPGSVSAEVISRQGFDSFTIDMQHGLIDYTDVLSILQATAGVSSVPLVRIPWLQPSMAMKVLDAGAMGVICPMINSAEAAETFVQACRYPPDGFRSVGPTRVRLHHDGYLDAANAAVLTIAQIETVEALENIEEIVAVEGLDAVYIGPADLAISMGHEPRVDHDDLEVMAAISRVLDCAGRAGRKAGIHCASVSYARKMIIKGFDMVTLTSDVRILESSASALMCEFTASGRTGIADTIVSS
jgi:2,4-dihydroxyhept-2-ene-1,7-dioic acid aldolase